MAWTDPFDDRAGAARSGRPLAGQSLEGIGHSRKTRVGRQLLELASRIEPDAALRARWWREDAIEELGGFTADELVDRGAGRRLRAFLVGILSGARG